MWSSLIILTRPILESVRNLSSLTGIQHIITEEGETNFLAEAGQAISLEEARILEEYVLRLQFESSRLLAVLQPEIYEAESKRTNHARERYAAVSAKNREENNGNNE